MHASIDFYFYWCMCFGKLLLVRLLLVILCLSLSTWLCLLFWLAVGIQRVGICGYVIVQRASGRWVELHNLHLTPARLRGNLDRQCGNDKQLNIYIYIYMNTHIDFNYINSIFLLMFLSNIYLSFDFISKLILVSLYVRVYTVVELLPYFKIRFKVWLFIRYM